MGSKKSTTTSTRDVPQYLEDASQRAVNLGTKIAERPHTSFQGDRFADLSQNEIAASNLAATGGKGIETSLQNAGDQLAGIKTLPESDLSGYMNPYTDQVTAPVIRNLNASAGRAQRNLSAKMGAGGGSGEILARSAIDKNLMQSIGDATAQGRAQAFNQAINTWSNDNDMKLRASSAWRDTAGDITRMNSQQVRDLALTGGADRILQQMNKDFDYQQFIEARDWDVNNLGPLLASLGGPHESTESTKTKKKGGALGAIIGGVATIAGAVFAPVTGGASLAVAGAVAGATKDL
jgi:hypothetical protein